MHSTHDVNCKKCGKSLAFWSGFGDNYQYDDEYQCTGRVWKYHEFWTWSKTTSYRDNKPTLKETGGIKPIHHIKELWDCWMVNESYYCADCAKQLKYKCPKCGKKIKLTRKK